MPLLRQPQNNTLIQRKYMTSPEMREAAGKADRQGHKRIVLVSGQLPNADVGTWPKPSASCTPCSTATARSAASTSTWGP